MNPIAAGRVAYHLSKMSEDNMRKFKDAWNSESQELAKGNDDYAGVYASKASTALNASARQDSLCQRFVSMIEVKYNQQHEAS